MAPKKDKGKDKLVIPPKETGRKRNPSDNPGLGAKRKVRGLKRMELLAQRLKTLRKEVKIQKGNPS